MTSASNGSAVYEYDGDGRRVRKLVCSISPCSAATPGVKVTAFVYDPEGALAQEYSTEAPTETGVRYLTADHLGSVRLQTGADGTPVKCLDYAPFGELLNGNFGRTATCCGTQTQANQTMFTGQYRDQETQIDFFEARFYASAQGRFVSPDDPLAFADPSNPPSWNLYGYAELTPVGVSNLDQSFRSR